MGMKHILTQNLGYAYGNLIFMCDPKTASVLENNISSTSKTLSAVRTGNSPLVLEELNFLSKNLNYSCMLI